MGPAHSGQTRIVLLSNVLGGWYLVGASWGDGVAMGTSEHGRRRSDCTRRYTEDREGQGNGGIRDGSRIGVHSSPWKLY